MEPEERTERVAVQKKKKKIGGNRNKNQNLTGIKGKTGKK